MFNHNLSSGVSTLPGNLGWRGGLRGERDSSVENGEIHHYEEETSVLFVTALHQMKVRKLIPERRILPYPLFLQYLLQLLEIQRSFTMGNKLHCREGMSLEYSVLRQQIIPFPQRLAMAPATMRRKFFNANVEEVNGKHETLEHFSQTMGTTM
uniref:Uncharacterized protein n=1 Tax=Solanum lycopersicum TaxID=4081 RepID=A0A3Q7HVE6_SOLLC